MRRLKDYAGFGVWFIGLGYILMWALTGALNWPRDGAGGLCADIAAPSPSFCVLAHPQTLSPLLQLVGLLAAIAVVVRLLLIALRGAGKPDIEESAAGKSFLRGRRPESTGKRIKARDHFGLRGVER